MSATMPRCHTCGTHILPIMRAERMILPETGEHVHVHDRPSCLMSGARFATWVDTPIVSEQERAERWARTHEGRPALPLSQAQDAYTHRMHDRRTPVTQPVWKPPTPVEIIRQREEAQAARTQAIEQSLVGTMPVRDDPPVRENVAPLLRSMLGRLESGLMLVRMTRGDDAVSRRMVRSFCVWHDRAGKFVGCVMVARDRRTLAVLADTGEYEDVHGKRHDERVMRRIAKLGAYTVTRMVRPDDWTYDTLIGVGGGFLHAGTERVA